MNSYTAGHGFRQIRRHLRKATPLLASPVHPPEPLSGFPHTVFVPLGTASPEAGKKRDWVFQGYQTYLFCFAVQTTCVKATQVSAIKEKLAGKGMAKAVLYFAKWRLTLPL